MSCNSVGKLVSVIVRRTRGGSSESLRCPSRASIKLSSFRHRNISFLIVECLRIAFICTNKIHDVLSETFVLLYAAFRSSTVCLVDQHPNFPHTIHFRPFLLFARSRLKHILSVKELLIMHSHRRLYLLR